MKTSNQMDILIESTQEVVSKFESQEELEMALECAKKIKSHFTRLVYDEAKVKYANNLIELDSITSQLRSDLIKQAIAV